MLVVSARATSTSILKNLVLPGVGHFTLLDHHNVSYADAGNNFFLDGFDSIGKNRAAEAVRLLAELNDSVEGRADTRPLAAVLDTDPAWLASFTVVVAHNLDSPLLDRLSTFLWSDPARPPLVVVRSAGFLAEFFIQFHEHTSEHAFLLDGRWPEHVQSSKVIPKTPRPFASTSRSRRSAITRWPSTLTRWTRPNTATSHTSSFSSASSKIGRNPYVYPLSSVLTSQVHQHDGNPPKTPTERQEFKKQILAKKVKSDEENFDEAEAQAYRCWTETKVRLS